MTPSWPSSSSSSSSSSLRSTWWWTWTAGCCPSRCTCAVTSCTPRPSRTTGRTRPWSRRAARAAYADRPWPPWAAPAPHQSQGSCQLLSFSCYTGPHRPSTRPLIGPPCLSGQSLERWRSPTPGDWAVGTSSSSFGCLCAIQVVFTTVFTLIQDAFLVLSFFLYYIYTYLFLCFALLNFSTNKIFICHYRLSHMSCGAINRAFSSVSNSFPGFVYLFLFFIFPFLIRHSITIVVFIFFIPYWASYPLTWVFHWRLPVRYDAASRSDIYPSLQFPHNLRYESWPHGAELSLIPPVFITGPANKTLRPNRWRPGSRFQNLWSKC